MLINLDRPEKKMDKGVPLLQLGFRPFFLLAGLAAALLMLVWGLFFSKGITLGSYGTVYWHGHEMVFGFVAAVIAGFLLTAVKNWTGRQTVSGTVLLLVVLLWLLARILPFFPGVFPFWVLSVIDISFLPVVAASIIPLLVKARNYRNLIFVGILLMLSAANVVFHAGAAGYIDGGQRHALYAAIYIILLLISIMGGRVIPFFIERGLGGTFQRKSYRTIEIGANSILVLLGILHTAGVTGNGIAFVALAAAALHLVRLFGWYDKGVWRVPLLWVLVLAYAWITVGLCLLALSFIGTIAVSLALHALTAGGIGLMTMGMMVRVSMGHSGRKLFAPGLMPAAFAALNVAVVIRVILPLVFPAQSYPALVLTSALIWAAAFAVFVFTMAPIYASTAVDSRSG